MKKGVLRNFAKFTGKHLCQTFLINLQASAMFSCEFCEISKKIFLTEQLWLTASRLIENI